MGRQLHRSSRRTRSLASRRDARRPRSFPYTRPTTVRTQTSASATHTSVRQPPGHLLRPDRFRVSQHARNLDKSPANLEPRRACHYGNRPRGGSQIGCEEDAHEKVRGDLLRCAWRTTTCISYERRAARATSPAGVLLIERGQRRRRAVRDPRRLRGRRGARRDDPRAGFRRGYRRAWAHVPVRHANCARPCNERRARARCRS